MASPTVNGHPSTPPASDPASVPSQPTTLPTFPPTPLTSLTDDGDSKRPRDARLIHLVLSSLGIHSYQERVPLQLLDFAYRYTSSVLSDSLRLSAEGYQGAAAPNANRRGGAGGGEDSTITVTALRQAIASRTGYHFHPGGALPKQFMMEQAEARNKVALPRVERGYGVQLPPEKYCLTGVGWGLREDWESEEEGVEERENGVRSVGRDDEAMGDLDGAEDEEDEEGVGRMEDVFGEEREGDTSMGEG
ncbi:Transcription initiation factor TFIID subunit 9 [Extremus antarcticus]|uniref:Transcription initiation factor TFIID subunit 9 n=1 Tax=Extremus antarcticus TaxID=702011 RepID=A0AAJ0G671_9PEZI|nr:Transcription initiation factor TFIID subunit 9 [Extremus antarcticus]